MPENTFKECVTIITGASSGIGRELAYQLAEKGAWLALGSRDRERLEAVERICQARGGRAMVVETDVCNQSQCQHLVERTMETYGHIDNLINNAGITMWALFEELHDLSGIERIMQTNYFGSVYCTHYALPYLKARQGRLIVISSLTGMGGVPTRTGYAASKHALVGFFSSLRIELRNSGVSVTVAYPDFVVTEAHRRALGPDLKPLGKSPLQEEKVMSAAECARLILAGAEKRKRTVVMGRGRILQYLQPFFPELIDRIAAKAIKEGV